MAIAFEQAESAMNTMGKTYKATNGAVLKVIERKGDNYTLENMATNKAADVPVIWMLDQISKSIFVEIKGA